MKKGFTLAEVLITLVILGIVMAITIPVLNGARPDKDKTTYQKALYNIQAAMSEVMQDSMATLSTDYWADDDVSESGFCEAFTDALNHVGAVSCSSSSYTNPNLITTDGIRFWGLEGKVFSSSVETRDIYIDRQLTNKEISALSNGKKRDQYHTSPGLKVQITYDGKVQTGTTNDWKYENSMAEKFVAPINN